MKTVKEHTKHKHIDNIIEKKDVSMAEICVQQRATVIMGLKCMFFNYHSLNLKQVVIAKQLNNVFNESEFRFLNLIITYFINYYLKPFTEIEMLQRIIKNFCFSSMEINNYFYKLNNWHFSSTSVTKYTSIIAKRVKELNKSWCEKCFKVAIQLDESTDINDISHIVVFAKGLILNEDGIKYESKFLGIISHYGSNTAFDTYQFLFNLLDQHKLRNKIISITTNGCNTMLKLRKMIKSNLLIPILDFTCYSHTQNLIISSLEMDCIFSVVNEVLEFIYSHKLVHRQFIMFNRMYGLKKTNIPRYNKTRWLSRRATIQYLAENIEVLTLFLETYFDIKNCTMQLSSTKGVNKEENLKERATKWIAELNNEKWRGMLYFYSDILNYFSIDSLISQKKSFDIDDMFERIKEVNSFINDSLICLEQNDRLSQKMGDHYKNLKQHNVNNTKDWIDELLVLKNKFKKKFDTLENLMFINDFFHPLIDNKSIKKLLKSIKLTFNLNAKNMRKLSKEIEVMKTIINKSFEFICWSKHESEIPLLCDCYYCCCIIYPTSVECEREFSLVNNILTKKRNRLTNEHLEEIFLIKSTSFSSERELNNFIKDISDSF